MARPLSSWLVLDMMPGVPLGTKSSVIPWSMWVMTWFPSTWARSAGDPAESTVPAHRPTAPLPSHRGHASLPVPHGLNPRMSHHLQAPRSGWSRVYALPSRRVAEGMRR